MYNTVLFDLDGTLTDPKLGITKSVHYSLKKFSIEIENLDDLDKFIGPPLKDSFMDFYSFSEEKALQAIEYYREYFATIGLFENKLYECITELLDLLIEKQYTLAVATSKPTVFAEKILDHFNLTKYFKIIVGSNLDNSRTDKQEIISFAISELNKSPMETIMIGDRKHDIIGANKNGIDSIGVLYGYGNREELIEEGATFIVENIKELQSSLLQK